LFVITIVVDFPRLARWQHVASIIFHRNQTPLIRFC
jgi:hypothetical protein